MTIEKFFLFSILQWLLLAFIKLVFFNLGLFSGFVLEVVFYVLVAAVSSAMVRRFGVINFFESFFAALMWFLGDLFLDYLVLGLFTGRDIFTTRYLWLGNAVLVFSILLFHKKRHIHIRKELHSHH